MTDFNQQKEVLLDGLEGRKRSICEALLDNQNRYLSENGTGTYGGATNTANIARFEKVAMPMIRRITNATFAQQLVGVQPLSAPVGIVNTLRVRYSSENATANGEWNGKEAGGVNLFEKYSYFAGQAGTPAADGDAPAFSDGLSKQFGDLSRFDHMNTLALEFEGGQEMDLEIVKDSIETKTRKLRAKWSLEADQDAKAMHGVDIESEMVAALADEITREQDREIIADLWATAGTAATVDMSKADGRWSAEKYKSLHIAIEEASSQIAAATKRGEASWIVTNRKVAIVLRHALGSAFQPAGQAAQVASVNLNFDFANKALVGTLNGVPVFVDQYQTTDAILMGYKGSSELDTGYVFCPYIPLMQSQVVINSDSFDPSLGMMTRYGTKTFTDPAKSLGNSSDYYRALTITGLELGFTA